MHMTVEAKGHIKMKNQWRISGFDRHLLFSGVEK